MVGRKSELGDHTGGSILLACTETQADVDVDSASLLAIEVRSIG